MKRGSMVVLRCGARKCDQQQQRTLKMHEKEISAKIQEKVKVFFVALHTECLRTIVFAYCASARSGVGASHQYSITELAFVR